MDLDGRGPKAMPGPCITCHGGRGDALMPPDASGKARFNLVQNAASGARGDVQARLHPFEVDAFDFSAVAGFTRAEQEAAIKTINRMVLCSYPLPAPSEFPEDACRRPATADEWQGTAAALIKSFYGGDGLPSATFSDTYVPASWQAAGQTTLYQQVVAPACRTCHLMRGTGAQSDIDFATWEKFRPYAERTKAHVFERGNMPLAKIVYDAFWRSNGPSVLATFLQSEGFDARDASGAVVPPGRPVADPGPSRVVSQGATRLSAAASLYASGYAWTIVSGPAGASLADAGTAQPTFTATANGTWTVQLVASNGAAQSKPAQIQIVVDGALSPAPAAIRFADIKAAMQAGNACTSCHSPTRRRRAAARVLHGRRPQRRRHRRRFRRRRVVPRGGPQPDQLHRPRGEPAAAQALGQPPQRGQGRGLRHLGRARRPRAREVRPVPELDPRRRPAIGARVPAAAQ